MPPSIEQGEQYLKYLTQWYLDVVLVGTQTSLFPPGQRLAHRCSNHRLAPVWLSNHKQHDFSSDSSRLRGGGAKVHMVALGLDQLLLG